MDWAGLVDLIGAPAAGLAILAESAGVPVPGEALLLGVAAWAAARHQSLAPVAILGFAGATAGSDVGFWLGHRGGRPFVERFGATFHIRPERLARAELFFARHGDRAILFGRFALGLRTWGSLLAGMARMPFWRFQLYSVAGDIAWIAAIVAAGYVVGTNVALLDEVLRAIGIGGVLFLVFICLAVWALLLAQERAARRP